MSIDVPRLMQLVRLPESQRDGVQLERARQAFIKPLRSAEAQLDRTPYIAGERFTYGDIPLGIRVHRWFLFGIERSPMPNIERWYTTIRERPAFQVWTANPAHRMEG